MLQALEDLANSLLACYPLKSLSQSAILPALPLLRITVLASTCTLLSLPCAMLSESWSFLLIFSSLIASFSFFCTGFGNRKYLLPLWH